MRLSEDMLSGEIDTTGPQVAVAQADGRPNSELGEILSIVW